MSGAKWGDYVAWNTDWEEGPFIWRIIYDGAFVEWMLKRVEYFMACIEAKEEPDLHYIKPYVFGEVDDMRKSVEKEMKERFGTFLPPPVKVFALM